MIKKYTILTSPGAQDFSLSRSEEVICDVTDDNDQGLQMSDAGSLVFTCADHNCVIYGPGTWIKVFSA